MHILRNICTNSFIPTACTIWDALKAHEKKKEQKMIWICNNFIKYANV